MATPVKITRATLAAKAAARWAGQYPDKFYGEDKLQIGAALQALGPNPGPDAVDLAIGNGSWTEVPQCNGCGVERAPAVVQVGEEPDYDSATAYLCGNCLIDALRVITSES